MVQILGHKIFVRLTLWARAEPRGGDTGRQPPLMLAAELASCSARSHRGVLGT